MEETYSCEDCEELVCDTDCIRFKEFKCPHRNCSYCRSGNCFNGSSEKYCINCFVDVNKNFYNKYEDTILTAEKIKSEEEMIDLFDFGAEGYKLNYLCPTCKEIIPFELGFVRDCDQCGNYVCHDCSIIKYFRCGYQGCRYCANRTCYNAETKCYCSDCKREYFDSESESEYESESESESEYDSLTNDQSDSQKFVGFKDKKRSNSLCEISTEESTQCNICLTNKKKYACVPCGHLCMCGDCANKINGGCPICKNKFTDIIKIFM